ncbi:MAG: hypothetical protein AB1521_16480 [Bacteroidota bacterium]
MEIDVSKDYNIVRLQQFLDYELSTILLFILSWFWQFTLILIVIAAVIFTPFMLKVLFQERKFGWIIFFVLMVGVPLATFQLMDLEPAYRFATNLIPLLLFYFYCFLLRLAVRDWIH